MKTQDRTITLGEYRFNEKKHLHELLKDGEYKPLTGVTTVLGVIAKPMLIQWAANLATVEAFTTGTVEGLKEEIALYPKIDFEIARKIGKKFPQFDQARLKHKNTKESAGEWGTETHSLIEQYIKWCIDNFNGEAVHYNEISERIDKFSNWAVTNKVKFLASEKHIYSERMWVGGICDIICEIDGKRYVGDIKTSSGIYPEAFIQCSAYAAMLEEMGEYKTSASIHPDDIAIKDSFRHPDMGAPRVVVTPTFDGVIVINLKKDGTFDWKINYDIEGNFKCFEAALAIYRHLNQLK